MYAIRKELLRRSPERQFTFFMYFICQLDFVVVVTFAYEINIVYLFRTLWSLNTRETYFEHIIFQNKFYFFHKSNEKFRFV